MDEASVKIYLELCRERIASQDNTNREFTTKATGVIAFGATIFVVGSNWLDYSNLFSAQWVFSVLLASFLGAVALLALSIVIRPREWAEPFDLKVVEEAIPTSEDGHAFVPFLADVARSYRAAVNFNDKVLQSKRKCLTAIAWFAIAELGCLILLKVYQ